MTSYKAAKICFSYGRKGRLLSYIGPNKAIVNHRVEEHCCTAVYKQRHSSVLQFRPTAHSRDRELRWGTPLHWPHSVLIVGPFCVELPLRDHTGCSSFSLGAEQHERQVKADRVRRQGWATRSREYILICIYGNLLGLKLQKATNGRRNRLCLTSLVYLCYTPANKTTNSDCSRSNSQLLHQNCHLKDPLWLFSPRSMSDVVLQCG